MRKFFLRAAFLTFMLFILGGVGMLFLSQVRPLRPGDVVFPVQYLAERQRAGLMSAPLNRAYFELTLLEKRIEDLSIRTGTRHESTGIHYLNLALDHASNAVAQASADNPANQPELRTRFLILIEQLQTALAALEIAPQENGEMFQSFEAKVASLYRILDDGTTNLSQLTSSSEVNGNPTAEPAASTASPTPGEIGLLTPQGVPFPPGSAGAEHLFYPLIGQHAVLECAACHPAEQYAGTPSTCVACHQNVLPQNHFSGDCATCHTPLSWQDAVFDHALYGATDCLACHTTDTPANHYAGQCSACHNTSAWLPASFDHSLVDTINCMACHSGDTPANHYAGQCSTCHNTINWANVNFDHTGQTSCSTCHTPPTNHYPGQCSDCHSTNNWGFRHTTNLNCLTCHSDDEPDEDDHPRGVQCSDCHNTDDWDEVDDDDDD